MQSTKTRPPDMGRLNPDSPMAVLVMRLWRRGCDTLDIAKALDIPEATVYNSLPMLRALFRSTNQVPPR